MPIFPRVSSLARAVALRVGRSGRAQAVLAVLTIVLIGTSSLQNAVANGDTRTLYMFNNNTGESGTFTFKREGRYDPEALKKLNWFLRDWRHSEPTDMDPELFDLVWEVYREVGAKEGITVLSGYRSPATNSMLRSRSKAVAEQSQHMRGKAMDFYMPGVELSSIRVVGLRMQRGGVGFYPGNNFVHLDTGSIRHWPRMTHDQLVRVFPDEKTVHIPSDGKPLAHYQEALAELEGTQRTVEVASSDAGEGIRKFFASLFSFKKSTDEVEDDSASEGAPPTRMQTARDRAADQARVAAQARQGGTQAVASARPEPAPQQPAPQQPAPQQVALARPVQMQQEAPPSASVRVAAAPLPSARPAEIAATILTAQAVLAPLPNAPLPTRRPMAPDPIVTASIGPVPLPAVITRGTSESAGAAREQTVASLSSAPAQGFSTQGFSGQSLTSANSFNSEGLVPPGLISQPPSTDSSYLAYAPSFVDMDPGKPLTQATIAAPALQRQRAAKENIPFGRMFVAPQMTAEPYMKLPEMRTFATFMAPPRVTVATGFSQDPTNGLSTTRFTGTAMAALPVHVFTPPSVRVTQRTQ